MKRTRYGIIMGVLALLMSAGVASALSLGDNVTIYDGRSAYYPGGWWGHLGGEDNEVEPGLATIGQSWDLEGFFLSDETLSVGAGYDLATALGYRMAGDLFIDVDGDWGTGGLGNNFGYEYVLDLNLGALNYSIYELGDDSTFWQTAVVPESDPWRRADGGTLLAENVSLLAYESGLAGTEAGNMTTYGTYPDTHTVMSVDLSFLRNLGYDEFWSHFTMQCGNDNLVGYGEYRTRVPDAASSALLLAIGALTLASLKRRVS